MSSLTTEDLQRHIIDALKRIEQLTEALQLVTRKIDAGDAKADKLRDWVKLTSDQSIQAMKEIAEVRKERVEDSGDFLELSEVVQTVVDENGRAQRQIEALEKKIISIEEVFRRISAAKQISGG